MIRAIVAMDPTGLIGLDGSIPWRYPADFAHFKRSTMGGVCIMGRKTFESIPRTKTGEVLPGRDVVVLTRSDLFPHARVFVVPPGGDKLLNIMAWMKNEEPDRDVWICGGAEIYEAALPYVEEIHVTWVPKVEDVAYGSHVTVWDSDARGAAAAGASDRRLFLSDDGYLPFSPIECEQPPGFAESGLRLEVLRRAR